MLEDEPPPNSGEAPTALTEKGKCGTCGDQGLSAGPFLGKPRTRVTCPDCGR